jgi:DNA repair exonuclease SbcCD ATPase subunit
MRIKFDKLRIQNFYSYGDKQELDFGVFKSDIVLIDGVDKDTEGSKIGSGKSSLMAAVTYVMFGETVSNVKANDIVNYIKGKDALVELEFFVEKQKYKVERGRKPKILNIFKQIQDENGDPIWQDISKTDDRDNDNELKKLFRMNFETFLQTSFFSVVSEYNKPFLNLSPTHQKRVLEDIFNFDVHNMQISDIKDKLRDEQVKLVDLESSIKEIKFSNEKIQEQLIRLEISKDTFEATRQKNIKELNEKIAFYTNIDVDAEKEKHDFLGELTEHKNTVNEQIAELKSSQKDVKTSIDRETRELEILSEKYGKEEKKNISLKGNICPTCNQEWEDNNAIIESDKKMALYSTEMLNLDKSIAKYEESMRQITTSLEEKREIQEEIRTVIGQIELSIDKKELYNLDIILTNFKKELEQVVNQQNYYDEEIEANRILIREVDMTDLDKIALLIEDLKIYIKLSEDPKSRGRFLRRYIKQSNEILRGFKKLIPDYNIHIQFNPDFTIRVMKIGKEVNPGSLSNGEKRIGNIMIMMTLMKVFKIKNNVEFNAIFMDEVLDSGINGTLLESVFVFIENVAKQEKMKVFLISHREEIKEKVKEVIMVSKSRGISTIEINPTI